MIAEKNPVINKAVVRLAELSQDERARMLFESRQMLEWDIDIGKRTAVKTREQEIVQNALQMGMSFDDIIKLTGLTYEEVENLGSIR